MLRSPFANILIAAVAGALFLTGLVLPGGPGGLLLLAVAVGLGVLTRAAWPAIPSRGRPVRLAILLLVLAIGAVKIAAAQ